MFVTKVDMPGNSNAPVRKSAQRLRWFKETMHRQIEAMQEQSGVEYAVDDNKIRSLFLRWLDSFEAQKPKDESSREDYVNFAAGLMLRELIRSKPVIVKSLPKDADTSNPAYYWPEGYLYVVLCLNIRAAVFEQDFDIKKHVSPNMEELRIWWSFKENMYEDPNLAVGFFDLFADVDPSWTMPSIFSARMAKRATLKYFSPTQNIDLIE